MVQRPKLLISDMPKVTLAAGIGVCRAIESVTGMAPEIKWPNDILINGKKVCGILVESSELNDDDFYVVLGVGLNVLRADDDMLDELAKKVTSLEAESGISYFRGELLAAAVVHLDEQLQRLEKEGMESILKEFETRDAVRGRELSWVTQNGKIITGVSMGLDRDGMLMVKDSAGTVHVVISGDIHLHSAGKNQP